MHDQRNLAEKQRIHWNSVRFLFYAGKADGCRVENVDSCCQDLVRVLDMQRRAEKWSNRSN